jgi:hypothetical protein
MKRIENVICHLRSRLESEFGLRAYELRLFEEIVGHITSDKVVELTHEEELCLALADAYDQ